MAAPKVFSVTELALIERVKNGESAAKVAEEAKMKVATLRQWVNKDKPKTASANPLAELKAVKRLKALAEEDADLPASLKEYLNDYFNDLIDSL